MNNVELAPLTKGDELKGRIGSGLDEEKVGSDAMRVGASVRQDRNSFTVGQSFLHGLSSRNRAFMGMLLICLFIYIWDGKGFENAIIDNTKDTTPKHTQDTIPKGVDTDDNGTYSSLYSGQCSSLCSTRENNRLQKFGGNLLDPKEVLRLAKIGFEGTIDSLQQDYGDYVEAIFNAQPPISNTTIQQRFKYKGTKCVSDTCISYERMKRKLKLKVLRMMRAIRESESNVQGCDCIKKKGNFIGSSKDPSAIDAPDYYESFVYANGGHSSGAGHGNKFKESYTAVAGRSMRHVWEAIGIQMIDRNYAMGGQGVTPHVSACMKEVMGIDVDLLSWNSGMTDKKMESMVYYFYRGAVLKNRPALWGHDVGERLNEAGPLMENVGLTVFKTEPAELHEGFPDITPGGIPLTEEERSKLPRFVDCQKCNGGWCGCDKWSCPGEGRHKSQNCTCPKVGARTGWHPGFRSHALRGHSMALGVLQMLLEGLEELAASNKNTDSLLDELEAEESQLFENFLQQPIHQKFITWENFTSIDGDFRHHAYTGPSICRTSMLPAESRFLGITTNTNKTGEISRYGHETYDVGIYMDKPSQTGQEAEYIIYDPNTTLPLGEFSIMAPRSAHSSNFCEEVAMPDYKDWFYAPWNTEGKAFWTFPHEKEKEYYGYTPEKFKGILGLIFHVYAENYKRKNADFTPQQFQEQVRMRVNGEPVTKYRWISFAGNAMLFLERGNGDVYWPPSPNNDYVLEFEAYGSSPFPPDGRIVNATTRKLRFYGLLLM